MWPYNKKEFGIPKTDTDRIPMPKCEPPREKNQVVYVLTDNEIDYCICKSEDLSYQYKNDVFFYKAIHVLKLCKTTDDIINLISGLCKR